MPRPRPRGLTIIALLLAWTGVSLVFLALARPIRNWSGPFWHLYLAVAVLHGITAWIAAFGLWELRPWARIGYGIWALVAIGGGLLAFFGPHVAPVSRGLLPIMALVLGVILGPVTRYIWRCTRSPVRAA